MIILTNKCVVTVGNMKSAYYKERNYQFKINVNGTTDVELNILKEKDQLYTIDFKFDNKHIKLEEKNLDSLIGLIGKTLKNNLLWQLLLKPSTLLKL